jgi:hypothetical protein
MSVEEMAISAPHAGHRRQLPGVLLLVAGALFCSYVAAGEADHQVADEAWAPTVSNPAFDAGDGPVVMVDAAHGNLHTIDGRFGAFAELLRRDGYQVRSADTPVTGALLGQADVFVISNALLGGDDVEWTLPTPSAFTPEEIDTIAEWVAGGGSLLLIADHMPFPGAAADLANAFGIVFLNGFAVEAWNKSGTTDFTRSDGSLADHPITRGRSPAEAVSSVRAFTGQAFRFVAPVEPLMFVRDDWQVLLPIEAWEHSESTPYVSARGLVQGGTLLYGDGRVAVFGEAAMFTAQTSVRDGVVRHMGMNHPLAAENPQFVLNVLHWLSGLLD